MFGEGEGGAGVALGGVGHADLVVASLHERVAVGEDLVEELGRLAAVPQVVGDPRQRFLEDLGQPPVGDHSLGKLTAFLALEPGAERAQVVHEAPGLVLMGAYFTAIPPLLAFTKLRRMYQQLGFVRYNLLMHLLLFMALLPIKMVLRWTINLKYIVAIKNYNV